MILKKLAGAVRRQDWFTVLLEVLIVVLGVFIGIQVANWNEAQSDRKRELVLLGTLVEDVREDIADIEVTIAVETSRISALDHLVRQVSGASLPKGFASARGRIDIVPYPAYSEDQDFDIGYTLFIMNSVPSRRAAYETIIITGGLGLIQDTTLVREIQEYYARADSISEFEDVMQLTRQRFVEAQRQAGISPVDEHAIEDLIDLFSRDVAMTAAAKEYWLFTNYHLRLLTEHGASTKRLGNILERAIRS
ncbi:MAG: DUF6090 family protein [Wenzhouxiangellaceae bacterium]